MGIMEKNMENIGVTGPVAAHTPAGEGQRQQSTSANTGVRQAEAVL